MGKSLLEVLEASSHWLDRKGCGTARLDAELLVGSVLDLERLQLYLNYDRPLDASEEARLRELVTRRGGGEPLAYLLGHKDFHAIRVPVGPGVLIPRPETEMLVDEGLATLPDEGETLWLDLCTGSACVAAAAASQRQDLKVVATELDPSALDWAARTVASLELGERVALRRGDLFEAVPQRFQGRFQVITANPPYVAEGDPRLQEDVRVHEPASALFADGNGLAVLSRILDGAATWLATEGILLLEMGEGQGEALSMRADQGGWREVEVLSDLAGIGRVLKARRPA